MQESDPAPEGDCPVNAKAARIEHTLSTLDKLPDSFKGALACREKTHCSTLSLCVPRALYCLKSLLLGLNRPDSKGGGRAGVC